MGSTLSYIKTIIHSEQSINVILCDKCSTPLYKNFICPQCNPEFEVVIKIDQV